jgi:hypothetical protein
MTRQTASGWKRAAIGAVALSLSGSLLGCGLPPGQFIIVQNNVPSGGCVIPAGLGDVYRGSGDLDVRLVSGNAAGYTIFPVVQNNLPPPTGGSADNNRIALSGFEVSLSLPPDVRDGAMFQLFESLKTSGPNGGPDPLIQFSTLTSGSVASGGGNTASFVDAISGELAQRMRSQGGLGRDTFAYVMATIRAKGNTTTMSVRSDAFRYPIRVCDSCLVHNMGACPVTTPPSSFGNACNIAQDQSVDCCTSGVGLVCPPTVAAP